VYGATKRVISTHLRSIYHAKRDDIIGTLKGVQKACHDLFSTIFVEVHSLNLSYERMNENNYALLMNQFFFFFVLLFILFTSHQYTW